MDAKGPKGKALRQPHFQHHAGSVSEPRPTVKLLCPIPVKDCWKQLKQSALFCSFSSVVLFISFPSSWCPEDRWVSRKEERLFSKNGAGFGSSLHTRSPLGWLQLRTLRGGQLFFSLHPFLCSLSSSNTLLPSCARPTQKAFLFPPRT